MVKGSPFCSDKDLLSRDEASMVQECGAEIKFRDVRVVGGIVPKSRFNAPKHLLWR